MVVLAIGVPVAIVGFLVFVVVAIAAIGHFRLAAYANAAAKDAERFGALTQEYQAANEVSAVEAAGEVIGASIPLSKGVVPGWFVPAADGSAFVLCLEHLTVSGGEQVGAPDAAALFRSDSRPATKTVKGSGCGPQPASYEAAVTAATP